MRRFEELSRWLSPLVRARLARAAILLRRCVVGRVVSSRPGYEGLRRLMRKLGCDKETRLAFEKERRFGCERYLVTTFWIDHWLESDIPMSSYL